MSIFTCRLITVMLSLWLDMNYSCSSSSHPCSWLGETRLKSSWPPGSLLPAAHIAVCAGSAPGFLWLSLRCSQSTGPLLTCTALRSWGEGLLPWHQWYGQLSSLMSVNCRKKQRMLQIKKCSSITWYAVLMFGSLLKAFVFSFMRNLNTWFLCKKSQPSPPDPI